MKKLNKKFFVVGIAALAIAVGAAANVGVFLKKDKLMSGLSLANVEALACKECAPNTGLEFITQGAYPDETIESKPCTEGINLWVYYVEWEGTRIICHNGGHKNCSTQICSE